MGQASCPAHSVIHARCVEQRHTGRCQCGPDQRRVAADQDHRPCVAGHGLGQRAEVLPLADAAQDGNQAPLLPQPIQGSDRGAHVGALAVVEILHFLHDGDRLNPVRLATVLAQAVQQGPQRAAGRLAERQRRQRIQGVVPAADAQGISRHQPLQVQLLHIALARLEGLVGLQRAHQPDHAIDRLDAEVPRALWQVATKGDVLTPLRALQPGPGRLGQQGHHQRVVAIKDHQGLLAKHPSLGAGVGGHAAVPVQVVLAQVQHHGCFGLKASAGIELEA